MGPYISIAGISAFFAGWFVFVAFLVHFGSGEIQKAIRIFMVLIGLMLTSYMGWLFDWSFLLGVVPWGWIVFWYFTIIRDRKPEMSMFEEPEVRWSDEELYP